MQPGLVECVPNFSLGGDPVFLEDLRRAVQAVPGAVVLDASSDADHNRSVLTFAAAPAAAEAAALAAVGVASAAIDMRNQRGVHPRIGATDVLPFIPLEGVGEAECVALAHRVGERMAAEFGIPIFFYGAAAKSAARRALPELRRGGYEALAERSRLGQSIEPDCGPTLVHPSAGASAVGVRPFLVAYNINLAGGDLALARSIARAIRESNGGLPAVRALGLWLAGPGLAQVSINLCDFRLTGVLEVFERVESLARQAGVGIHASELIGLVPRAALDAESAARVKLPGFEVALHVIEERVQSMSAAARQRLDSNG